MQKESKIKSIEDVTFVEFLTNGYYVCVLLEMWRSCEVCF